jgi:3-hydroxyisobutyrate dehydrogenase-like beta-hydroxyacid dehydrogenase
MTIRAGVIGLGAMGLPISACIAQAGFPVSVFDVRDDAVARAVDAGAQAATSPAAVAAVADVVCIVVFDEAQVDAVLFGPDGIVAAAVPGTVVCICSTIDDEAVPRFAARAAASGVEVIDAGVAGGAPAADAASLVTMVGGPDAVVERARPVLDAFSKEIVHAGPLGAGMQLKLVKNLGSYLVLCAANETVLFAEALGIDAAAVHHVNEASNMLEQFFWWTVDRPTNQRLDATAPAAGVARARGLAELARKDLDAIQALAARMGVELPAAHTAHDQADRYFLAPLLEG